MEELSAKRLETRADLVVDRIPQHSRAQEGRPTVPLPPRFALAVLHGASAEDNEDLTQMWAGLIANAMDPNNRQRTRRDGGLQQFGIVLIDLALAGDNAIVTQIGRAQSCLMGVKNRGRAHQ